jgi:NAD(P)-dependent dehydrogenase (short-subunit alcohol dehydrogenase family)
VEADIRSPAQVAALFEKVIARFGRLDPLVDRRGADLQTRAGCGRGRWSLVIDTSLKGCFPCTRQAGGT